MKLTRRDFAKLTAMAGGALMLPWQLGRKLRFDPVKEEFIGDAEANRLRSRAMRSPWMI